MIHTNVKRLPNSIQNSKHISIKLPLILQLCLLQSKLNRQQFFFPSLILVFKIFTCFAVVLQEMHIVKRIILNVRDCAVYIFAIIIVCDCCLIPHSTHIFKKKIYKKQIKKTTNLMLYMENI